MHSFLYFIFTYYYFLFNKRVFLSYISVVRSRFVVASNIFGGGSV